MKKCLLGLLVFLMLCSFAFGADTWVRQSAAKTVDAAITTAAGRLYGIIAITDATNPATIAVYDNATAASGTVLIPTWTVTTSATDRWQMLQFNPGVQFVNGLYVDMTIGAGALTYMIYYQNY